MHIRHPSNIGMTPFDFFAAEGVVGDAVAEEAGPTPAGSDPLAGAPGTVPPGVPGI